MYILCILNANYWMAIPHQLAKNEAIWSQGVVYRYWQSYFVCEGREENFVLTLGIWIFPRPASMSYSSGILLAAGYTCGISYSGNVSRRISTLFTLWFWRVL